MLVGEQNCQGLCSTLTSRCIGCNKEFQFSTSSKVQGMSGGCCRWLQREDMHHLVNQWQY